MTRHVVVAIDDSARAPAVLSWALDHADPSDEIVVLAVWNLAIAGGLENPFSNLNEAQIDATRRVNKLIERVALERWESNRSGGAVRADVRHGDPATELVRISETADLLVLGNCHYNAPGRLGSISEAVIYGARCAVALVPVTDLTQTVADANDVLVNT